MPKRDDQKNTFLPWLLRGLIAVAVLTGTSWGIFTYYQQSPAIEVSSKNLTEPSKEDLQRWLEQGEERHVHEESGDTSSAPPRGEPVSVSNRVHSQQDTMSIDWNRFSSQLVRGLKTVGIERRVPVVREVGFDLPRADGSKFSMQEMRGKWILLNFWASWCVPCREEMPALERLANRLPRDRFQLVGVNVGEDSGTVDKAIAELGISFPVLRDEEANVTNQFRVQFLPTTWIVTPDGSLLGRIAGAIEWDQPPVPRVFQQLISKSENQ